MEKSEVVANIKKLLTEEKLVLGTNVTLKQLKKGNLKRIYISSNIPQNVKEDIKHYASLSKVEVIEAPVSNEEFGIICKKSFLISVIGQK